MSTILLLVFFMICASALCSMVETSLASISLLRIRQLKEQNKKGANALLDVKNDIDKASNTIVVINNIINIAGSMLVTSYIIDLWGDVWVGLCSGALTFLIIMFAEIIPKAIGYTYPEKLSLAFARPLKLTIYLLTPFIHLINVVTSWIIKDQATNVTERDILGLIKVAYTDGRITDDEYQMACRVFLLNDKNISKVTTPRTVMTYLKGEETLAECKEKIISSVHSRMPVIADNIDLVIGIALKQELMKAIIQGEDEKKVKDFLHKAMFAFENKRLDELLREFIKQKQHMAVVFDEYGGVEGVVTLEDILEELMGQEIVDETDKVDDLQIVARRKGQKKLLGKPETEKMKMNELVKKIQDREPNNTLEATSNEESKAPKTEELAPTKAVEKTDENSKNDSGEQV